MVEGAEACDFECYMGGPEGHVEFRLSLSVEQCHTRVCVHLFTPQMLVMPVFPNYQDITGLLSSSAHLQ